MFHLKINKQPNNLQRRKNVFDGVGIKSRVSICQASTSLSGPHPEILLFCSAKFKFFRWLLYCSQLFKVPACNKINFMNVQYFKG